MKENTFICEQCGQAHPISEGIQVGEELMCPSCADELTVICQHCGERIYLDDAYGSEDMRLCRACFENHYVVCDRCGSLMRAEHAQYAEDDEAEWYPLCDTCVHIRDRNHTLHRYDYKPEPIFYGSGLRHLGVELELDGGGQSSKHAQIILAVANREHEHLYVKTDGSLDDGIELVTHPMTLDYHMREMTWAEMLEEESSIDYLSHKAGTCGLHIQNSRKAIGITA